MFGPINTSWEGFFYRASKNILTRNGGFFRRLGHDENSDSLGKKTAFLQELELRQVAGNLKPTDMPHDFQELRWRVFVRFLGGFQVLFEQILVEFFETNNYTPVN